MIAAISNFRSAIGKKIQTAQWIECFYLIMAVVISSAFMTGCSTAKGRDLAPREEILKTLRAQGFVFNKYVISTVYGENQNQVIVSGRLAQRTPDDRFVTNGIKLTQYKKIVVENVNGAWEIRSTQQVHRKQLSSRQRW